MSDWEIVRHTVAIAGRVTDDQTDKAIGGAQVRIIDAPEVFIAGLITQARLVALQDVVIEALRAVLDDPEAKSPEKLQAAQVMLDYDWLITRAKLLALRGTATTKLSAVLDVQDKSTTEKLQEARTILDSLLHTARRVATAERPDRACTAADGHFHFLDLPDGEHTLVASLPGAGTRYGQSDEVPVTVSRDAEGNIILATAHLKLPPTLLKGQIAAPDGAVVMAEEQVVGRGLEAVQRQVVTGVDLTLTPTTEPEPEPAPELAPPPTLAALFKPAPPPEFTPNQIPGCQLWLTAEDITGLRDGDPVAVWPDRSGHDHQAAQTEEQQRPRYQAQGIGGQPAVHFDGADDSMTLEFSEPSTDHTFFFVYDQPTPGEHNNFLFDAQAGRLTLDSAQAASPHQIRWQDSIWHPVAEAVTGPQILTWVFSSTTKTGEVLRNGTSLGTGEYTPRSLDGLGGKKMTLGPNCSSQYSRLAGSMAAAIYYNRALKPEERQQVEQYLSERFGIPFGQ